VIREQRPIQSKAEDWATEISLAARIPDRMPKSEVLELAKSAFAIGYQRAELAQHETRVERNRDRIQLGSGARRVTAFVFEPPYPFIEVYSEPGLGALTAWEAVAFAAWLRERAVDMKPPKPKGWLRRLVTRRRQ
jgi:hypothetical protein